MEVTQPSSVPSGSNQQTVPSPPLHPPQSVVGMPSPPTPRTSAQVSAVSQLQYPVGWRGRVQQRRKRGNIWVSVIIGGLIGCALLTAIVAVVLLAVNNFLEGTVTPAGATLAPDALSTRQALLDAPGGSNDTDATPVFTNVTPIPSRTPELETSAIAPIGSRPTATFDPDADFGSGDIIYFAQRDDDFDIFRYNLRSGVEQPLTIDHVASTYPAVSLDGGRMTFQSDLDGDFDIYVMDLNIRSSYIITENDTLDRLPAWSPDGVWVIRYSGKSSSMEFHTDRSFSPGCFGNHLVSVSKNSASVIPPVSRESLSCSKYLKNSGSGLRSIFLRTCLSRLIKTSPKSNMIFLIMPYYFKPVRSDAKLLNYAAIERRRPQSIFKSGIPGKNPRFVP
jgi:hypothetical protein